MTICIDTHIKKDDALRLECVVMPSAFSLVARSQTVENEKFEKGDFRDIKERVSCFHFINSYFYKLKHLSDIMSLGPLCAVRRYGPINASRGTAWANLHGINFSNQLQLVFSLIIRSWKPQLCPKRLIKGC